MKSIYFNSVIALLLTSCKGKETKPIITLPISYDIVIVAGQSNTCYGAGYDSSTFVTSGVLELGRFDKDRQIIRATPSLNNHSQSYLKSSFGYYFADLYQNSMLENRNQVLVIACLAIGTTLIDHDWNKGDHLHNDLVERTNFALATHPGSKVVAILWQHGESDMFNDSYQQNLDSMIVNLRQDLNTVKINVNNLLVNNPVPIFLGGMVPYCTNLKSYRINQQNIIANTENRLPNCYYVDPNNISKPDNTIDTIHYSHQNQILLGEKYWLRYKSTL